MAASIGSEHGPSVAAVRLTQEASALNRALVSSGPRGVRDITHEFVSASDHLPLGELVKDDYFTLFEAVGALEIMDPKMDSGFVPSGDDFEPDFDAAGGLDPEEILWIMERLLCFEMTFHEGYPLSQNIFTSLHIFTLISPNNKYPYLLHNDGSLQHLSVVDNRYNLVHVVLRAYCVAVLKCCQGALETIQSHTFYEEEDFVTFLYGRELLPKLASDEAQGLLTEAIEWLDDTIIDAQTKNALISHLEMRGYALACMDDTKQQWAQLKSSIDMVEEQHGLSKPVPAAFSDKVQRQLATSTPPRPMPDLSWQDACDKWKHLCDDALAAYHLTRYEIRCSPANLQNATWAFAYRQPAPNTFARAKMQDILTGNDTFGDDILHFDHLLCDIRELVLAGDSLADPASFQVEVPSDPRHICSRLIEDFMSRVLGEYLNLFRMLCLNRCRMRRTFTQAVPLLDDIETEARATDQRLHEIIAPRVAIDESGNQQRLDPLSLWSRLYKLQMVEWVVQLGFETDIYLPEEFANMYMLLIDFSDRRREELTHLERCTRTRLETLSKTRDRVHYQACLTSTEWIRGSLRALEVNLALASALTHLYAALEKIEVINVSTKPYSSSEFQYEARMKPLLHMANDTVPSLHLLEGQKDELCGTVGEICARIASFTTSAKMTLVELRSMKPEQLKQVGIENRWRAELKRLETVCVAITVNASQLLRVARKHGKVDTQAGGDLRHVIEATIPPPGKRYHDWWVVPQLKEKNVQ